MSHKGKIMLLIGGLFLAAIGGILYWRSRTPLIPASTGPRVETRSGAGHF